MFAELSGCKLTTAAAGAGVQVRAQAPDVEGNAALNGQVLEVEVAALTDTVGSLKARIAEVGPRLQAQAPPASFPLGRCCKWWTKCSLIR